MAKSNVLSMVDYVVRTVNDVVDVQASVDKFYGEVLGLVKLETSDYERIDREVNAVFDAHLGATLSMDCLINTAMNKLGVDMSEWDSMKKRVHKHVQANASKERADGAKFGIRKGMGGGVFRWSEHVEKDKK